VNASGSDVTTPARLGPVERSETIRRLGSETFDVVVVGGGSTGCGCAVDAAGRGLSVALVEARDFAAGTSSRSSKLFHGGLRYLEQGELHLVREALRERGLMLNVLAPHLVQTVSFMYPLRHRAWERLYVGAGMLLYDELGGHRGMRRHRHLTKRHALRLAPALDPSSLIGALQYQDCQVDDARHTLSLARTAAQLGAAVGNAISVTGFLREAGRVTGVQVLDHAGGNRLEVRARVVINATGVWTDELQHMLGERGKFHVTASKGVHIVVPRDRLQLDTGLILPTEKSVLFVIPWGRHWLIGTTDTEWTLDKSHPAASRADIDYLLQHLNAVLEQPLAVEDVEGVFAGLRPLLSGESDSTSRLSREHSVASPAPGLIAVAGGKYTTYRVMARDAVDAAARSLDRFVPPSVSDVTPLLGADGFHALWNRRHQLADRSGLHIARVEHLLRRQGTLIDEILELVAARPELAEPLPGADDYLTAEALYAASHEGALHVDDVLARRTRASIESWDRGEAAAEPVARLMAEVLGWSREDVTREVELYRARVTAERDSQRQADDRAADAARLMAPHVLAAAQGEGSARRPSA
jgi:glycerol-3-phosphate dehydrogenase